MRMEIVMINRIFVIKKQEWLVNVILMLVGLVIGVCIEAFALKENEMFEASTLFIMGLSVIYSLFLCITHCMTFSNSVTMGRTRKEFLLVTVSYCIIKYASIVAAGYISHIVHKVIFCDNTFVKEFDGFFRLDICLAIVIGVAALEIFIGVLYIRFKRKAFWFFWVIWMVMCLLPARVQSAMQRNNNSFLARFGRWCVHLIQTITKEEVMITGGIVVVVMAAVSSLIILNEDV